MCFGSLPPHSGQHAKGITRNVSDHGFSALTCANTCAWRSAEPHTALDKLVFCSIGGCACDVTRMRLARQPLCTRIATLHTGSMARPDGPSGDDRPPDPFADGPGDDSTLAVSIPDDASELAAEISAYQRELRAQRRRRRLERFTLARYWRPYG